jgi:5-methylcytosine-specific restriction endonuclease McrA
MAKQPDKVIRNWIKVSKPFERNAYNNTEIYNSWKWRKFASRYKKNNPLCAECDKNNIASSVKVADHIKPINAGGEVYNEENIQSLCEKCHNRKSANESRGYGVKSH